MNRVIITAGFDRAKNAIAVAELATRHGNTVQGIIVVSALNWRRLRGYVRQRGLGFIGQAFRRITGVRSGSGPDEVDRFLQENDIRYRSLKKWCRDHSVPLHVVRSLNETQTVDLIEPSGVDWVVYGGGGVLKRKLIKAARGRILNAHAGPLPEIRGMNACEWALLLDERPEVSIHLIDRGIDTGGVIKPVPLEVLPEDDIESIRAKSVVCGIQGLVDVLAGPDFELPARNEIVSRQCFVMAPALKELLTQKLQARQAVKTGA